MISSNLRSRLLAKMQQMGQDPKMSGMSASADMPRMGMLGGRRMAEALAQRAGAMGPRGAGGAANATNIGERSGVKPYKKGGNVKKMAKGGSTASKRADGCATKGKTKGRFV